MKVRRFARALSSGVAVALLAGCGVSQPPVDAISGANVPPAARVERAIASGTFTTLYSFQGQPDGAIPQGSVDVHSIGTIDAVFTRIYGNTSSGGTNDAGTIYELNATGMGSFSEEVLLSYTPSTTGSNPTGAITSRSFFGDPLGTAQQGGVDGKGTVVELLGASVQALLSLDGHNGAAPSVGVLSETGSLSYATTFAGGRHNRGAIVAIRTADRKEKLVPKLLYSFSGKSDGEHPNSVLTRFSPTLRGTAFYGTTAGSKKAPGTVYAFVPRHGITTLYTFKSSSDGVTPTGVVADGYSAPQELLFGTTVKGGSSGYGTLYVLKLNGSTYTKTTLHTFTGGSGDGAFPQGPLALGPLNSGYGVTKSGGSGGCGTIFSVDLRSTKYTSLYSFTCGRRGAYPEAPLTFYGGFYGNFLYGTTSAGGTANEGTVFSYKI
jgi:uncharacterized repeat protein (TIGR03803 family)